MAHSLDVYLGDSLSGHLNQDDHGEMTFAYTQSWLDNIQSIPISHSLPLRPEIFSQNECRAFFSGLLPENGKREIIARNLGISARNDFKMLAEIGGECAGAITFIPNAEPLPSRNYRYRPLSNKELANILRELPRRPLMAGNDGIRLSLAGVQDKIAVHVSGEQISLPLGNSPSTHILKPAIDRFEGVVFNEAFCMNLAREIGLRSAKVETRCVEDIDYLLVERYDRKKVPLLIPGIFLIKSYSKRVHQEDFCQALGVVPERKYQNEGGPSIKACFDLLRSVSTTPAIDLQQLLDGIIFNFLVGNNDAHGKNFSLTYDMPETIISSTVSALAPLYDIVCTAYYPDLTQKMAMAIGGEYRSDFVLPKHFELLAEETGLARPLTLQRVREIAAKIINNLEKLSINPVSKAVGSIVAHRCQNILKSFDT